MTRYCRKAAQHYTLVSFDGSLKGGGATLQIGVQNLGSAADTPILAYVTTRWRDSDLALLEVARDDPAGQAKFEAYTLALALNTWQQLLQTAQGRLAIRGDALGILHDVLKLRAREPKLNALAHQMAYILAPIGLDVRLAHVWTERNTICDNLSRCTTAAELEMPQLSKATRMRMRRFQLLM